MKRVLLTAVFIAGLCGAAGAQGPVPDPWGPSNMEVVPAPGGGGNGLGFDAHRWNYWQTQSDTRGNLYGYDANGNYWTYNRRTNTYSREVTEPRWQARCYLSTADFC
jgi:opacity protein-like surface antigen